MRNGILFSTLKYIANANCISFPMQSPSFPRLSCVEDEKCLICSQNLDDEREPYSFGEKRVENIEITSC